MKFSKGRLLNLSFSLEALIYNYARRGPPLINGIKNRVLAKVRVLLVNALSATENSFNGLALTKCK